MTFWYWFLEFAWWAVPIRRVRNADKEEENREGKGLFYLRLLLRIFELTFWFFAKV